MNTTKWLVRKMYLLSCAKKGYISIDKAVKKLGWSKPKVVAVGCLLAKDDILEKVYVYDKKLNADMLIGFNVKSL